MAAKKKPKPKKRTPPPPKPSIESTLAGRFRIQHPGTPDWTPLPAWSCGSKIEAARIFDARNLVVTKDAKTPGGAPETHTIPLIAAFPLDQSALEIMEVCAVWRALGGTLAAAHATWKSGRSAPPKK